MTTATGGRPLQDPRVVAPAPRLGSAQALAANVAGVVMNLSFKLVAALPASEIIVLRSLAALVPLAWLHARESGLRGRSNWRSLPAAVWIRSAAEAAATLFVVIAVTRTSLALVTAISLTIPILVSGIGVLVFGERSNGAMWMGIGLGLLGALLVLQPTLEATPLGMAAAALAAICYATRDSVTLHMPERYSSVFLTLTANLATLGLGIVLAAEGGWRIPTLAETRFLAVAIVAYIISNILVTMAVRNAGLILSGVFRYATIPTALAFDFLLFQSIPTITATVGTMMVVLGGFVVVSASARLRRRS